MPTCYIRSTTSLSGTAASVSLREIEVAPDVFRDAADIRTYRPYGLRRRASRAKSQRNFPLRSAISARAGSRRQTQRRRFQDQDENDLYNGERTPLPKRKRRPRRQEKIIQSSPLDSDNCCEKGSSFSDDHDHSLDRSDESFNGQSSTCSSRVSTRTSATTLAGDYIEEALLKTQRKLMFFAESVPQRDLPHDGCILGSIPEISAEDSDISSATTFSPMAHLGARTSCSTTALSNASDHFQYVNPTQWLALDKANLGGSGVLPDCSCGTSDTSPASPYQSCHGGTIEDNWRLSQEICGDQDEPGLDKCDFPSPADISRSDFDTHPGHELWEWDKEKLRWRRKGTSGASEDDWFPEEFA